VPTRTAIGLRILRLARQRHRRPDRRPADEGTVHVRSIRRL